MQNKRTKTTNNRTMVTKEKPNAIKSAELKRTNPSKKTTVKKTTTIQHRNVDGNITIKKTRETVERKGFNAFLYKFGTNTTFLILLIGVCLALFAVVSLVISGAEVPYKGLKLDLDNGDDAAGFGVSIAMFILSFTCISGVIFYRLFVTRKERKRRRG